MSNQDVDLDSEIAELKSAAFAFFDLCSLELKDSLALVPYYPSATYYWSRLSDALQTESNNLSRRIISLGHRMAVVCKGSALVSDADMQDLSVRIKEMRAAIQLRSYYYWAPEVAHDEGSIIGFTPAQQGEEAQRPEDAKKLYASANSKLLNIYQLASPGSPSIRGNIAHNPDVSRYRPNSAFIMMWMDPAQADLVDVNDAVRDIFFKFGVHAIRADEIEHEGMITPRILEEIKTSEFLFADLTGARPNVYYEVGYAHALGKRVILFRKAGTGIHFDLAGYNCPEYENLRDLKSKLQRRLSNITNKNMRRLDSDESQRRIADPASD